MWKRGAPSSAPPPPPPSTWLNDAFKNLAALNPLCWKNVESSVATIASISICGKKFTGEKIRSILGLKSSKFDISIGKSVNITTYGYGHGVGMSQYGAAYMGQKLKLNFMQILKKYYM